jgi:hypothetical protein
MRLYHLLVCYVQVYATCFDLFISHHLACSVKAQAKFHELGCPNMEPYYAVGSCYYQASIPLDKVKKVNAKY